MPSVSIVIPSYLRHDKLRQCIQSIIAYTNLENTDVIVVCNGASREAERICVATRQQRIAEYEAELQTVDSIDEAGRYEWLARINAALDALRASTKELPISLLWFPEAIGYPRACNEGIKASTAEYVVLFNDDCLLLSQPKNQWIEVLLHPFLSDDRVGITGPQRLWDENSEHYFLIFFCVMLRRKCLDGIGLLDEITGLGFGEDTIACIEAERKGWKVLQVPDDSHTNTLADIDPNTTTLEAWKHDKIWCGNFHLFHDAESTLGRIPNTEDLLRRNRALLKERYGKQVNTPSGHCEKHPQTFVLDKVCIDCERDAYGTELWRASLVDGWFGVDEGAWLARQVKALPAGSKVLEIGSWHGRSSRFIADNLPKGGQLWCVDTWIGSSGEPEMHGSAHYDRGDHAHQWWWCNLQEHIEAGRCVPVRMHSDNAAHTFAHLVEKGQLPKFDLIFVDGDHSEEGIKTDVEAWLPLLKDGGLICGHDYYKESEGPQWVHVRQYVEAKFPNVEKAATSIWYTRPVVVQFGHPEYPAVVEYEHRTMLTKWFEDVPKDAAILDVGCGDGVALKVLGELEFTNLSGLDLVAGAIVGDMHNMPFTTGQFDVIYSSHSLEHARDPLRVLDECYRVLKPSGQMFLILPYIDYLYDAHRTELHCGSEALGLTVADNAATLLAHLSGAGFEYVAGEAGNLRNEMEIYLHLRRDAKVKRGYIYDTFIFNDELDVLELRLETLYDHVDRFVLVEGVLTHSGQPKPLHFDENKERFSKYLNKIHHVVVEDYPPVPDSARGAMSDLDWEAHKAWTRERHQRDQIMAGLANCGPDDIVIVGDADEIIGPDTLVTYSVDQGLCRLKQRLFYYYLNCENKEGWDWLKIAPYRVVKELTPCGVRYPPAGHTPLLEHGGWHFSFLGGAEAAMKKVRDYAHVEYATDEFLDKERIAALISEGRDIFGRDLKYEFVEIDEDYPQAVRDHYPQFMAQGLIKVERQTEIVSEPEVVNEPATILDFRQSLARKKHWTVTAEVSTKDRYTTTLPLTLSAIITQTHPPDKLTIYDDGEHRVPAEQLSEMSPFSGLLKLATDKKIDWTVMHTPRQGQVANHQHCLDTADTDYIWRVDDDEIPAGNCLEVLLNTIRDYGQGGEFEKIGAVGGLVHNPGAVSPLPRGVDGTLADIGKGLNLSWFSWNSGPRECEHLYSTFLFRVSAARDAGGYPTGLSVVGHREESWFTNKLHRAGYKVVCTPHTVTHHLHEATGGIRSFSDNSLWESDEQKWQAYLRAAGVVLPESKMIVCDFGLGDHLILKGIWPELQRKFPERKWTMALCYPEVFKDEDVTIISIADAKLLLGNSYDSYSAYKYAWENNFVRPMPEVMLEFFSR